MLYELLGHNSLIEGIFSKAYKKEAFLICDIYLYVLIGTFVMELLISDKYGVINLVVHDEPFQVLV